MGSSNISRFNLPQSNLVLSQNFRKSVGNYSLLARLQHNRGDLDGTGPMMFTAA